MRASLRTMWGTLLFLLAHAVAAQQADTRAPEESLAKWAWYQDIKPAAGTPKYVDFLVMPAVFDKARGDLLDLRLRDAAGKEVPYVLRERRDEDRREEVKAEEFNHTRQADRADELSLDLGAKQVTHNEMLVRTTGSNFRRLARVEGSDRRDGDWKVLAERAELIDFRIDAHSLQNARVHYPTSRFRYLRVRVSPDAGIQDDRPTITAVNVFQSTRILGERLTLAGNLGEREPVKTDEGPGSAWIIELGGDHVPCSRLRFQVDNDDFVRDYRLEVMPEESEPIRGYNRRGPAPPMPEMRKDGKWYPNDEGRYVAFGGAVTSGQWRRRAGTPHEPMEISFNEVYARRLRLVVFDNRNPPLQIRSVEFSAAAREVVFDGSAGATRLYFGNPAATDPNYDFGRNLPMTLSPAPERTQLEAAPQPNPIYHPEPPPWTERWPWLIYVVLGVASLALIAILGALAREAVRRHDAGPEPHGA